MEEKFEMSDLGLLSYYLGMEVNQRRDGISLKQTSYATKVLKQANMWECNPTKYPMEPGLKLSKLEGGNQFDATEYRKIVGCLRYLTHTRPDLSYAVGYVSRYMQAPRTPHQQAVKQILRYVKGSIDLGIFYQFNGNNKLIGFSGSSYSVDMDDGKGTTGLVFFFNDAPVAWNSQKQPTVALSSCEAEFMATTSAACQAIWMKGLLAAIALMKNLVFHGRSKHINTRYHFIRECVENNQVKANEPKAQVEFRITDCICFVTALSYQQLPAISNYRRLRKLTNILLGILDVIIIMLAVSTNGAREIAHISATCKLFRSLAERAHVLREINFRCLAYTEDFTLHHHPKDLLCVCTQIGHLSAKSIFAKALLFNDRWFKQMIADSNQEALDLRVSYSELLDYHSVVRTFIRHGNVVDIIKMYDPLLNYVTSFVGFKVARKFGMLDAIKSMCSEMTKRVREHRSRSRRLTGTATIYPSLLNYQVRGDRKKVLDIFDKMFPSRPV
ncbi:hypothetical protein E3N88_11630 [Mikania micrantha]|uniref:Reverse transcriptase Ty1/copia-type domain-containing protein n=1 Tax=Mikania micrantha TaxID=192012 RepID=A0A5N6PF12_9ASTR|nr:hypothetical protein E3N88_11630 [Mikania micrantha]